MKKNIFIIVLSTTLLLIGFIFGNLFPIKIMDNKLNFSDTLTYITPQYSKIRICNNTNLDFDSIKVGDTFFSEEIVSGECSNYKNAKMVYEYMSSKINVIEDGYLNIYTTNPMDIHGVKKIGDGEHTININYIEHKDKYVKEYRNSIIYDIIKK